MAMGPMGHAAMIGAEVPAPGGPNELDALLYPPKVLAHKPGRVREYTLVASDRQIEVAKGVFFSGVDLQRHGAGAGDPGDRGRPAARDSRERGLAPAHHPLPRHSPGEHGRRLRDRRARGELHLRVPGPPLRHAALPLPFDAAEEAHRQGPLRGIHHRPAEAAPACTGARDAAGRLRHRWGWREQLLQRQRPRLLLREVPDPRAPLRDGADLPREPDGVRSHQLVPPSRRVLPLLPDRFDRSLRVHGHRDALPGTARASSRSTSTTPAGSCSTRTSRSSPSWAGWASSTWSPDGSDFSRGAAFRGRLAAVGADSAAPARRRRRPVRVKRNHAARPRRARAAGARSVRHPPGRIQAGRDHDPGDEPAAEEADDRERHGRRRHRSVPHRRADEARQAALEHESWCRTSGWTDDPYTVGVTSSTGIETTAAVRRRGRGARR